MSRKNYLRIKVVAVLFLLMFVCLVVGRLLYIQIIEGQAIVTYSTQKRLYSMEMEGARGSIYDRGETSLLINRKTQNFFIIPVEYIQKRGEGSIVQDAEKIAAITDVDPGYVLKAFENKQSWYRLIKRDVTEEQMESLKALDLPGLSFEKATVREYTQGSLLSNVLGFVSIDGEGQDGLEKSYEEILKGSPGEKIIEVDRYGHVLNDMVSMPVAPVEGKDLILSIDSYLQYMVESIIRDVATSDLDPEGMSIIIEDIATGDILSMASYPTYDPADRANFTYDLIRNRSTQFNYEPGSVFKLITVSSALDSGVVSPDDVFKDDGYIVIDGFKIKNWDYPRANGKLTAQGILERSSNAGAAQVGLLMGKEKFYEYIDDYGFGHKTGIDLNGEEKGLVRSPENMVSLDLGATSIGQSIMVTPLQMVTAVATMLNDGFSVEPHLVTEIRNSDGSIDKGYEYAPPTQVISKEVSDLMAAYMESVVSSGTGSKARIEGYRIGGKTGTAQKIGQSGEYVSGKYVASFVGAIPMDSPRYAVIVVVDEPKGIHYTGGQVAAPIAKDVMDLLISHYDISPVGNFLLSGEAGE